MELKFRWLDLIFISTKVDMTTTTIMASHSSGFGKFIVLFCVVGLIYMYWSCEDIRIWDEEEKRCGER